MKRRVFRLRDIEVDEVSVVDHPANKRRFIVVKRSDNMPSGSPVVKNADGTLTTQAPDVDVVAPPVDQATTTADPPAPDADKVLEQKAAPPPPAKDKEEEKKPDGPPQEPPAPTKKSSIKMSQDTRSAVLATFKGVADSLALMVSSVESAEAAEADDVASTSTFLGGLAKIAGDIQDIGYSIVGVSPDGEVAPAHIPVSKRMEVRKAKRILDDYALEGMTDVIEKYGAKIKKEHLSRISGAMKLLSDVLSEVSVGTEKRAEQPATDADPRVSALEGQVQELSTRLSKMVVTPRTSASNSIPVDRSSGDVGGAFKGWPADVNEGR